MGRRDVIVIKPLFPVMSYILNIMVLISDSDIKINCGAEKCRFPYRSAEVWNSLSTECKETRPFITCL